MAAVFSCAFIFVSGVSCGSPAGDSQTDGLGELDHRIFVTASSFTGDLGGLSGADLQCQTAATQAGLTRSYKAIMSDNSETAKKRLNLIGGIYKFEGSKKVEVVSVGVDLWNPGGLTAAVDTDENGNKVAAGAVWTGTDSDGGNFAGTLDNCQGWSSSDSANYGAVGRSDQSDGDWVEDFTPISCDLLKPIYCISQ